MDRQQENSDSLIQMSFQQMNVMLTQMAISQARHEDFMKIMMMMMMQNNGMSQGLPLSQGFRMLQTLPTLTGGYSFMDNLSSTSKQSSTQNRGRTGCTECKECCKEYDSGHRRPLILPKCGHTFCKSCLRQINNRGRLRCPKCGSEPKVDVNDLPTNMSILDMVI
ncbi:uncharacterized protein [Procambarus clarkii]